MPRLPRSLLVSEDTANHCTWRSHDHAHVFEHPGARHRFLELLSRHKAAHGIRIHSYCLMGTHPHVVCTATRGQHVWSAFWKVVNQRFARWYNRSQGKCGQVVMERLRSPRIQTNSGGRHMLMVMRYGDLNPVRAGLVGSPKDWPWSSYRHYAYGEANDLIDDAPAYLALGATAAQRRKAYQSLLALGRCRDVLQRRTDFVRGPFIGAGDWVAARLEACGLSPPLLD